MHKLINGVLCIVCLALTACASLSGLSEEFNRSVKAYNRLLRWHELESAGMTYIDPALQDEYQRRAGLLKTRGLSITDFRILTTQYHPEKKTGDVVAEFDYYILPSNRIKTLSYRQEWLYREELKSWKLRSGLPAFE